MEEETQHPQAILYRFGEFTFSTSSQRLMQGEAELDVENKVREGLLYFLEHAGETVTREEILLGVWGNTHKTDQSVTTLVNKLRGLLGAAAIGTVHGIGYRFDLPVQTRIERRPAPQLGLKAGDRVPHRPNWQLCSALVGGFHPDVWLGEHGKTGERRVFKFAADADGLRHLKREVTLSRLIAAEPDLAEAFIRIQDWQLDEPPYFIEAPWVGPDLAQWAEDGKLAALGLQQRLALVATLAENMGRAHALGMIHKDLKPANLLVATDEQGQLQRLVIGDFGSGRLLSVAGLEALGITKLGFTQSTLGDDSSQSGTALYLAPELLAGESPTTQADVYSLGILLFQMVIGDLRRPLGEGWQARVDDPLLREDIAAAVQENPRLRLDSALELAQRLRTLDTRHEARLQAQTAAAVAAAMREKLARQRARRPWQWAAAAMLTAGILASTAFAVRSEHERRLAESALVKAEIAAANTQAVADFMTHELFRYDGTQNTTAQIETLHELLRQATTRTGTYGSVKPTIDYYLGALFMSLNDVDAAIDMLQRAIAETKDDEARMNWQGTLLDFMSRYGRSGADELANTLASSLADSPDPWPVSAAYGLGGYYYFQGKLAEAIGMYEHAWAGRDYPSTVWSSIEAGAVTSLASAYYGIGRFDDARRTIVAFLDAHDRGLIPLEPYHLLGLQLLGALEMHDGHYAEALTALLAVESRVVELFPPTATMRLGIRNDIAVVLQKLDRYDEALARFDIAIAERKEILGPASIFTLMSITEYVQTALLASKPDLALAQSEAALLATQALADTDQLRVLAKLVRAENLLALDRLDEARALMDGIHLDEVPNQTAKLLLPQRMQALRIKLASLSGDAVDPAAVQALQEDIVALTDRRNYLVRSLESLKTR